jgi:CxxC motif-containing protein (DUF1111 family)
MKRGAAAAILLALLASSAGADDAYDQGKALFERKWDQGAERLGPLFNSKSCNGCHKDGGPSRIFKVGDHWTARGAVVRIGAADGTPDPVYGKQLQDIAANGLTPEAVILFDFDNTPSARIDFKSGAPAPASETEIRLAPSLAGRLILEQIDPKAILANEDPTDADQDGISGRARKLFGGALGRFGHTANTPSLARQAMEAAATDMGLSSTGVPTPHGDCTPLETACMAIAAGAAPEIDDESIALIVGFIASLPKPKPPADTEAKALFASTGCAACHVPELPDAKGNPLPVFTDLLLHDMGETLAGAHGGDGFSPAEWRTAPLIDMSPREGLRRYLHDGRAKTIAEAIMLHGGEGKASAEQFKSLPATSQSQLINYLDRL